MELLLTYLFLLSTKDVFIHFILRCLSDYVEFKNKNSGFVFVFFCFRKSFSMMVTIDIIADPIYACEAGQKKNIFL